MENIQQFIAEYILIPQAFAASQQLIDLMSRVNKFLINPLIILIFTLALVLFIFGLFNFFGNRDDVESLEKGKRHMLWGIVGMAIMVSVFGIMNLITQTLGVNNVDPNTPGYNISGLQN